MKKKNTNINGKLVRARSLLKAISTAVMLICVFAPLHGRAEANGAGRLAWSWRAGQVRTYRLELERTQQAIADNRYRTEFALRCDLVFSSVAANDEGAQLHLVLENLSITATTADRTQRFNSATPEQPHESESSPWARAGLAIVGKPIEIDFLNCGSIVIVKGLERELEEHLRRTRDASPRDRFEVLQIFGDEGLTNMLNSIFNILPDDSVLRDEWTRERDIELASGISMRKREYYNIRAATEEILEIGMRAVLLREDDEVKELILPQGRIAVNVKEFDAQGKTHFSKSAGCIQSQRNTGVMKLEMAITAASSNEKEEVESELRQTSSLRLLPQNTNGGRR